MNKSSVLTCDWRSRSTWRVAITGTIVLASVAAAPAAIMASATLIKDPLAGMPFGAPDAALPAPWVSYKLSVSVTPGDLQAAIVEIHGPLHQHWIDPTSAGNFAPTANSTDITNGDSHLLATPTMLFADGPAEDNPGTGSPLSISNSNNTRYGVGASLTGVFGSPGVVPTAMDIAYIVIPKGTERSLDIRIHTIAPTDAEYRFTTRDFFPAPEPSSMMLATLATAGVVGYVRRPAALK